MFVTNLFTVFLDNLLRIILFCYSVVIVGSLSLKEKKEIKLFKYENGDLLIYSTGNLGRIILEISANTGPILYSILHCGYLNA